MILTWLDLTRLTAWTAWRYIWASVSKRRKRQRCPKSYLGVCNSTIPQWTNTPSGTTLSEETWGQAKSCSLRAKSGNSRPSFRFPPNCWTSKSFSLLNVPQGRIILFCAHTSISIYRTTSILYFCGSLIVGDSWHTWYENMEIDSHLHTLSLRWGIGCVAENVSIIGI